MSHAPTHISQRSNQSCGMRSPQLCGCSFLCFYVTTSTQHIFTQPLPTLLTFQITPTYSIVFVFDNFDINNLLCYLITNLRNFCWLTYYVQPLVTFLGQRLLEAATDTKSISIHPFPGISVAFWPNDLTSLPGKSLIAPPADLSNTHPPFVVNKAGMHQSPRWNEMFWTAVSCHEPLWGVMMWCYDLP